MKELVNTLRPVLSDYEFARRQKEQRRASFNDWRVYLGVPTGLLIVATQAATLWNLVHGG